MFKSFYKHFCLHSWKCRAPLWCDQRSIANLQTILYWNILTSVISITSEKVESESTECSDAWLASPSQKSLTNKLRERGHCEQKQSENFAKLPVTREMMMSVSGLVTMTVNKEAVSCDPHYSIYCNPDPHLRWHWELAPVLGWQFRV